MWQKWKEEAEGAASAAAPACRRRREQCYLQPPRKFSILCSLSGAAICEQAQAILGKALCSSAT